MRPTAEQAMVRVQEYIDFLETNGVPTALFKERVQAVHAWGKSVRLRQPDAAQPRRGDEAIPARPGRCDRIGELRA